MKKKQKKRAHTFFLVQPFNSVQIQTYSTVNLHQQLDHITNGTSCRDNKIKKVIQCRALTGEKNKSFYTWSRGIRHKTVSYFQHRKHYFGSSLHNTQTELKQPKLVYSSLLSITPSS